MEKRIRALVAEEENTKHDKSIFMQFFHDLLKYVLKENINWVTKFGTLRYNTYSKKFREYFGDRVSWFAKRNADKYQKKVSAQINIFSDQDTFSKYVTNYLKRTFYRSCWDLEYPFCLAFLEVCVFTVYLAMQCFQKGVINLVDTIMDSFNMIYNEKIQQSLRAITGYNTIHNFADHLYFFANIKPNTEVLKLLTSSFESNFTGGSEASNSPSKHTITPEIKKEKSSPLKIGGISKESKSSDSCSQSDSSPRAAKRRKSSDPSLFPGCLPEADENLPISSFSNEEGTSEIQKKFYISHHLFKDGNSQEKYKFYLVKMKEILGKPTSLTHNESLKINDDQLLSSSSHESSNESNIQHLPSSSAEPTAVLPKWLSDWISSDAEFATLKRKQSSSPAFKSEKEMKQKIVDICNSFLRYKMTQERNTSFVDESLSPTDGSSTDVSMSSPTDSISSNLKDSD